MVGDLLIWKKIDNNQDWAYGHVAVNLLFINIKVVTEVQLETKPYYISIAEENYYSYWEE